MSAFDAETVHIVEESSHDSNAVEVFRKDYKPNHYLIDTIFMDFKLDEVETTVTTKLTIVWNPFYEQAEEKPYPDVIFDGEQLELVQISLNGVILDHNEFIQKQTTLAIKGHKIISNSFTVETIVKLSPVKNLELSGLYASKSGEKSLLCTQCEAVGFRRITYSFDRPDVLSKYTVRLEGNKEKYPLLLSNGNCIETGDLDNEKHYALWEDPFLKPSYLFAIVAGDLASIHSEYTTKSGRTVRLGIYSDKENGDKLAHAMYSLKKSMAWDEETFDLECDLDLFNVVAVNDFNMGAMENKGLNIFNASYVVADPSTTTDDNYISILGVIGHEYFHNWTGNRVTVRDWFQLTLKEGLTVFRDQWFTSDETGHAVKRIEDVTVLRSAQFPEDQGPMAHPIRPDSYIAMDNFYTSTVYEKGAEIIGIYRTILGVDGFKAGMKEYFRRHDGSAVTCDDFRAAMADANSVDLSQLELWYSQAGTPIVTVQPSYDMETKKYCLTLSQRIPSTPGQPEESKKPMLIPVTVGLISRSTGAEIVPSTVLKLTEANQVFTFENIAEEPVASVLRGFSAPVKLEFDQSDSDLALLMSYDTDSFNRWEAGNRLSTRVIFDIQKKLAAGQEIHDLPDHYVDAVRKVLEMALPSSESSVDRSLIAYALSLPDLSTLSQDMSIIDIDNLHRSKKFVEKTLATLLYDQFVSIYSSLSSTTEYEFNMKEVGRRRLRNKVLEYLSSIGDSEAISRAYEQYQTSNCMTDKIAALGALSSYVHASERSKALAQFYSEAKKNALVLNKWFRIQASSDVDNLMDMLPELQSHPDFNYSNPNRVRSLFNAFANNLPYFHSIDGRGYQFIADAIIEIDRYNPQVAAGLATHFNLWKRYDQTRQTLMKNQLERIKGIQGLSKDTNEIVNIALSR